MVIDDKEIVSDSVGSKDSETMVMLFTNQSRLLFIPALSQSRQVGIASRV